MKRYNLYNLIFFSLAIMSLLILGLSGCVAKSKYLAQVAETESTKAAFQDEAKKNAALNEQVTRLNSMLAEQKAKIEKLEGEKQEAARKIEELSSTINGLNADLEKAKEIARSDAEKSMSEIARLTGERDEAKKRIEESSADLARINAESGDLKRQVGQLLSDIEKLNSEAANLSSKLEIAKTAPAPVSPSAEEIARLEAEKEGLNRKADQLSSEINRLNSELSSTRTENSNLKGKIDSLSSAVANLTTELEKARTAIVPVPAPQQDERLREEVARLNAEREGLKGQIDQLTSELAKAKEAAVPIPAPVAQIPSDEGLKSEISRLEKEKAELERRMEEISSDRQRLARELDRAKDSIATSELERAKDAESIGRLKNEMARLEEEKKIVEKKRDELESEAKRLSSALEMAKGEAKSKEKEMEEMKQTYESLLAKLKKEVEDGGIKVEMVKEGLSVKIIGKLLFASGSDKLSKGGREVLDRISGILKDVNDNTIKIEGHTDNKPIGPKIIDRFPTNWELSTARATQVVIYLAKKGVDPKMMSAAGLSMYNPVATNDTKEGREQNRRIEIILYPKGLAKIE